MSSVKVDEIKKPLYPRLEVKTNKTDVVNRNMFGDNRGKI